MDSSLKSSSIITLAYGQRLVPRVVDDMARDSPQKECFQMPQTSDPRDGWRVVTFGAFSNAINRCSWKIIDKFGKPTHRFPPICYIGPNDARYLVFMIAAIKTGYKALFVSPRNSDEGQLRLLRETECCRLVFAKSHAKAAQPCFLVPEMQAGSFGSLEDWFAEEEEAPYPYDKSFEQGKWDPLVVLHTSGSTGFPKPIVVRQGMLAIADAAHALPEWEGMKFFLREWAEATTRTLNPMPLFHAAGLYLFVFLSIYWDRPVVLAPPQPLTADSVTACLQRAQVQSVLLPPVILEEMSRNDECIGALAKLALVVFGGATLARKVGDHFVEKGVVLKNMISATECAPFIFSWSPEPRLWPYLVFHSDRFGCVWRQNNGEEDYELFIRKLEDTRLQGYFYTFPDSLEFPTKDLYRPHPSLPHHWAYSGRADNIIVLSNGEKLNPITLEGTVASHPSVRGALVVGIHRFQPALLVEPISHPASQQEMRSFLDNVWKTVVLANKETVGHGKVVRDLITAASPAKPFQYTGKGTLQRALVAELYQDEIDCLYKEFNVSAVHGAPSLDIQTENGLLQSIKDLLCTRWARISSLDSLQVVMTTRVLRASLRQTTLCANPNALKGGCLYANPTPLRLMRHIMYHHLNNKSTHQVAGSEQHFGLQLYKRYTQDLQYVKIPRENANKKEQTVLLTGSAGMLGCYLLEYLARSPLVTKIICLNRSEGGGHRKQAKAMKEHGLSNKYLTKAEFHQIDASKPYFDLPKHLYARISDEADRIILNAWPVDFNIPLASFNSHLHGVRNFADFAAQAAKRVAVVFISSIGTADRWDSGEGLVPETALQDLGLASTGYGQSKLLGERILQAASDVADFPAVVIRVGQIAGAEGSGGLWKRHEWLPSIIASSLFMKALPGDLGAMDRVDWTPVERITSIILEIAGVTCSLSPKPIGGYYHGINPLTTPWAPLATAVQHFYGKQRLPEMFPFREWVEKLADSAVAKGNPGIKLIDTYRRFAEAESIRFCTRRTWEYSPAIRRAEAISPELMTKWLSEWGF